MPAASVIYTKKIGGFSNSPQIRFEVWITKEDNLYTYYDWYLYYDTNEGKVASTNGVARNISAACGGEKISTSYNFNGVLGPKLIKSGNSWLYKEKSKRWVTTEVACDIDLRWGVSTGKPAYASYVFGSGGFYINPITSYTIEYDANGGTGAPSSQTKWFDENTSISYTVPTRTGYRFMGWSTSASGSVTHRGGDVYKTNAALTLYAVWQIITYSIKYDANGGSGAPANQGKNHGNPIKLSSVIPTRKNYEFLGWATSSSATVPQYAPGAEYTTDASTWLYAVWRLAYEVPKIENLQVTRCLQNGTVDDFGEYILVDFDWACSQLSGENPIFDIRVEYYKIEDPYNDRQNVGISASGTSGSVHQVVGGDLSIEFGYIARVNVTDTTKKETTTASSTIPSAKFIMDFKAGGKGLAIGKPSFNDGFEVGMTTRFDGDVWIDVNSSLGFYWRRNNPEYPDSGPMYYENFNTIFTASDYDDPTPVFVGNLRFDLGKYLQARPALNEKFINLIGISKQSVTECDWTKGGLRGRVRKTIWTGSVSKGGSITIPEASYYNIFIGHLRHTDGSTIRMIGIRENPSQYGGLIEFFSFTKYSNALPWMYQAKMTPSSETVWTVTQVSESYPTNNTENLTVRIVKIEGVI